MGWRGTTVLLLVALQGAPAARAAPAPSAAPALRVQVLRGTSRPDDVPTGVPPAGFEVLPDNRTRGPGRFWLRIEVPAAPSPASGLRVLIVHAARQTRVDVYAGRTLIYPAASLAGYRGIQDRVYPVPASSDPEPVLFARIDTSGIEARGVILTEGSLGAVLERGGEHARMIALAVGGLVAMALASLLIWFVMADRLFVLYATFFFLQSLYIVYLSGQGFDWPLLWVARPLNSFAWNVPIALSGAVGCLFAREIAVLKDASPRAYAAFGGFAWLFVALTFANLAKLLGFVTLVSAVGNLIFFAVASFTLVVASVSWRRGNRAAGFFLVAWGLLQGFTIAAALRFLVTQSTDDEGLLYYGLPLSMLAAAVLIALGVADRLRQQRAALTDAERRAQTDPLTGVLNRRSLIERLEAACVRARARGLPIAVLFLDVDHFKLINDSFGHQAGDACLRAIIAPIHAELRQSDVIGRYGGEEFVVILSGADAAAALPIAQRIRERVATIRVEGFGRPIALTCSIGIGASDTLGVWGEQLISRADAAVYAAKRAGRDQVKLAEADLAAPTDELWKA